jgi:hypothetical protein
MLALPNAEDRIRSSWRNSCDSTRHDSYRSCLHRFVQLRVFGFYGMGLHALEFRMDRGIEFLFWDVGGYAGR